MLLENALGPRVEGTKPGDRLLPSPISTEALWFPQSRVIHLAETAIKEAGQGPLNGRRLESVTDSWFPDYVSPYPPDRCIDTFTLVG